MSQTVHAEEPRHSDHALGVHDITHGFDGTTVLEDVSLSLEPGTTCAIIGPSGTGKTTLLRLLALFASPDCGRVTIDGEAVWKKSERERLDARRRIGMVFQTPNLFDASVYRNVAYGRHIRATWEERIRSWVHRLGWDEPDESVVEALDAVGMAEAANQRAESLSGGEGQRVAFARALACEPDFLLLDEPTSDLDPRNTAVIEEAIEAARRRGLGIAMATHDMHQAERVADRVAVMIGGHLVEVGPTRQVFEDPDDERVRQFIEGELVY